MLLLTAPEISTKHDISISHHKTTAITTSNDPYGCPVWRRWLAEPYTVTPRQAVALGNGLVFREGALICCRVFPTLDASQMASYTLCRSLLLTRAHRSALYEIIGCHLGHRFCCSSVCSEEWTISLYSLCHRIQCSLTMRGWLRATYGESILCVRVCMHVYLCVDSTGQVSLTTENTGKILSDALTVYLKTEHTYHPI